MAFRFRKGYLEAIRKIAAREHLTQVRVLESAIDRFGKEIRL